MWIFNLVQRLSDGSIVCFRNDTEQATLGARRGNMIEGWLFMELQDGSTPAYVRYKVVGDHALVNPDITEVPHYILPYVKPPMLIAP